MNPSAVTSTHFNERAACTADAIYAIAEPGNTNVQVRNLALKLEDGRILLKDIDFNLEPGDRLIITGASGCGKSTLLRALAGMWHYGSGCVYAPKDKLYIFQKPYHPLLPLSGIISYPTKSELFSKQALTEALEKVGLERLSPFLFDETLDGRHWEKALSGGEQQKLLAARLILNKPKFLLLDEISAALDEKSEQSIYALITKTCPDAAIISISHRPAVMAFHTLHGRIENQRLHITSMPQPASSPIHLFLNAIPASAWPASKLPKQNVPPIAV